jgi:hypothetical protein
MKYSNLGTMNASSIRWSTAASKLERGRPRGNLLDALTRSNLATCSMPLLRQKQVPGWLQPHTTPCSSLPSHCQPLALLLPLHHVPLPCMQLLSCKACHLLPSIGSPAPCAHCVPSPWNVHYQPRWMTYMYTWSPWVLSPRAHTVIQESF